MPRRAIRPLTATPLLALLAATALAGCTTGGTGAPTPTPTRLQHGEWTAKGVTRTNARTCVEVSAHGDTLHVTIPKDYTLEDEGPFPLAALRYRHAPRTANLAGIEVIASGRYGDDPTEVAHRMAGWFGAESAVLVDTMSTAPVAGSTLADGTEIGVVDETESSPVSDQDPLRRAILWVVPVGTRYFGVGVYARADAAGDALRRLTRASIGGGHCG